jgi:hypothetical protein
MLGERHYVIVMSKALWIFGLMMTLSLAYFLRGIASVVMSKFAKA